MVRTFKILPESRMRLVNVSYPSIRHQTRFFNLLLPFILLIVFTPPLSAQTDTDGDGIDDATEINNNTNPNDPCDPATTAASCCTYQGNTIRFIATDDNVDVGHTTIYVVTNPTGSIEIISSATTINDVPLGLHYLYGINYQVAGGIAGLAVGQNISAIDAPCAAISAPFVFQNCVATPSAQIAVRAKAFLQGAFDRNNRLMRDDIRAQDYLPTLEPYGSLISYETTTANRETTTTEILSSTGINAIVDWVFLELRAADDPARVIATRSALLQRDGDIVDTDGVSAVVFTQQGGDYHLALRHRNHLGVMTLSPLAFSDEPTIVDFTDVNTAVWGTHARKNIDDNMLLWAGNTNSDGQLIFQGDNNDVDPVLFNVVLANGNLTNTTNFIHRGYYRADANLNGAAIYQGVDNDLDQMIFFNVLTHPANVNNLINFIVEEQLPR